MKSKEGISDNDVDEMIAGEVFVEILNDTDHTKTLPIFRIQENAIISSRSYTRQSDQYSI